MSKNSVKSALRASFRVLSNFRYFKNPQIYLCNFDPNVFFFEKLFFFKIQLIFYFFVAQNFLSLTAIFCRFCKLRLKIRFIFEKMAPNPQTKSDFGHF